MSSHQLKRTHLGRSTAGYWQTADGEFHIYSELSTAGRWKVTYRLPSSREWLEKHGFSDLSFPTRRHALERLQDMLELNPFPEPHRSS